MIKKLKERLSIVTAKRPSTVVLITIFVFNALFFLFAAVLISNFSLQGTEKMSFISAAYYTITMILDAGCIDNVITEIGRDSVVLAIICLVIIVIGMISFTGAVIGYITNYISDFVDNSKTGVHRLQVSDHIVILNWNSRASEIVNDLLYCSEKQTVIVLTPSGREQILKEIHERLSETIISENKDLKENIKKMPLLSRPVYKRKHKLKMNLSVIVREGDVFSSKQLRDICVEHAKTIIILSNDKSNSICTYEKQDLQSDRSKGNPQTIKALMQVADITASDESDDNQKIVVEITDEWTAKIVNKIIQYKRNGREAKCNIVPVHINNILGQLLSQFSIMPELNHAYTNLFSNKGATFYCEQSEETDESSFVDNYLSGHKHAIPLTIMNYDNNTFAYFSAGNEKALEKTSQDSRSDFTVDLNTDYTMERKNVLLLGHNSKCDYIMKGFKSFVNEWSNILHIFVIDDEEHLKKVDYYRAYPFVERYAIADIYDDQTIKSEINAFINENEEDTSILILSDDEALSEDVDSNSLSSLIYVQEIVKERKEKDPGFNIESVDIIVELIDPKHHDIVKNYSNNNIVISNKYISKMITQIGEKDALFDFYTDILTYDNSDDNFQSKEIYAKKVSRFFKTIPPKCTARELIHAVYKASSDPSLPPEKFNPTIVLGYVKPNGQVNLFEGNQDSIMVELDEKDRIIVFGNH